MDAFLRKLYVDMTNDDYNAFRPREDDVEGPMYSDKTIMRALRALEQTEEGTPERNYMAEMMRKHGPRAGVPFGETYPQSYEAGEDKFSNLLEDFREYRREGDLLGQVAAGGKGVMVIANPLNAGPTTSGFVQGLLRYMMERDQGD